MTLNIKDPEVHALATELAQLRQVSVTKAVLDALRHELEREKARRLKNRLGEELIQIGKRCAAHMLQHVTSADHGAMLYGGQGQPRQTSGRSREPGLQHQERVVEVGQFQLAYGQQFALLGDRLHIALAGARAERRNAEVPALPDLAGRQRVHHFAGEVRQQVRGGYQSFQEAARARQFLQLDER